MNTIVLRKFEERDIDFIYRCKNDEKLNSMVVGNWKPLTYEEAAQWVRNCMKGDRSDLKFWAVATNDDEQRIVGWVCLSQIDKQNKSACHHGIFIGDNDYRDGTAMFEAMNYSLAYVFQDLGLHRVYGSCLSIHQTSPHMLNALGFSLEGIERDSVCKNGRYYDISKYALLDNNYKNYLKEGRYETKNLVKLFIKSFKSKQ